jgi:flagellar hook-length control protein FliK
MEKKATINIDLTLAQAKSTQKQLEIAEMYPDKNASTTEIVMKSQNMIAKESMHDENDLSNTFTSQTFRIEEIHMTADKSKERGRSASDNPPNINLELISSHDSYRTQTAQQSSPMTVSVKTNNLFENNLPSDISADVGKQILESIQNSLPQQDGDRHVAIRLNPPELGKVFIKFQEENNELIGLMEVSKREIRFEIEQALPEIIRNLSEYGIQIRRLDVTLTEADRSDQEALGNQWLQYNESHKQDSANSENLEDGSDHSGLNEWLLNCNSYQHTMLPREVLIADNSINILI